MEFQIDHLNEVCSQEQVDDVFLDFEGIDNISNAEMNDAWFSQNTKEEEEEEEVHSHLEPSQNEEIDALLDSMSIFPLGSMEFDIHLIMAYCEAMEKERMLLADVISKGIVKKGNPSGEITERLMCYLFQTRNKQLDYLKQECMKNFLVCFRAFYHIFPYGMFAHFAANSVILNTICNATETIHIFDFDMGNGVQWSSFVASSQLQQKELKITSIKWSIAESPFQHFTFEETKKNLDDTARALGLKLTMDELALCDIKKMKKNTSDHKRDVYFFNCMVNLPHMMIARSRKDVMEFTTVAEQFASDGHNIVVTLGDGNAYDIYRNQGGSLCSFFEENLTQYRALLESMDHIFPKHLEAAKTAMGCLFVAPFVSSNAWIRKWEGQKELQWETVLEGFEVNEEIIFESKLMVTESESLHQVKVEGENKNEIVLSWRNHPLMRVSCWKS